MAVPKKRQTHGRTRRRRAGHKKIQNIQLISCPKCSKPVKPHYMCTNCGYYNKKRIIDVTKKLEKKEKKKKQEELKKAKKNKHLDAKALSEKK